MITGHHRDQVRKLAASARMRAYARLKKLQPTLPKKIAIRYQMWTHKRQRYFRKMEMKARGGWRRF